jgi:hypothetical protein
MIFDGKKGLTCLLRMNVGLYVGILEFIESRNVQSSLKFAVLAIESFELFLEIILSFSPIYQVT